MSFDGPALSFDDEGSILFDGEKIIVTVPVGHEALDHLGSEKEIPFPVVYTHPSHHQESASHRGPHPPPAQQYIRPSTRTRQERVWSAPAGHGMLRATRNPSLATRMSRRIRQRIGRPIIDKPDFHARCERRGAGGRSGLA